MLAQIIYADFDIGRNYMTQPDTTKIPLTIGLMASVKYGLGVVATALQFRLHRWGVYKSDLFSALDAPGS